MEKNKGYHYFLSPQGYFWKWTDAGKIIEWKNDRTICYTEDLANVIRLLKDSGIPSLGTLLLVLAACNDGWLVNESCKKILYDLASLIRASQGESDNDVMNHYVHQAITGMDRIAQLPADLRKGFQRSHILHEIVTAEFIVVESDEVLSMADETGSFHLAEFNMRARFYMRSQSTVDITRNQFLSDLKCLAQIAEKYPDAQRLEQKLRTGLDAIPLPAPIEFPEEKKQGNLLQQLLEEPRTTHISQLAKRMIAALHIPMHFQRSGGASYGGVSDITNRGNFDKLLLSELAADNTLLLTRLVHNEALYLRREEPPNNPKTRRLILLDTTIRLWGTPRVFAVSAAIACTQNLRSNESVEAYTLGGKSFTETDLATTEGVLQTLEQLDAALHCTNGLSACIEEVGASGQTDTIFITGAEMITEPSFQKWLATAGEALDFIITVNGDGELHFSSVSAGRLKQLSSAKIDLEEILAEKKIGIKLVKTMLDELPAFLKLKPAPLLFPVERDLKNLAYSERLGVAATVISNRLLYWYQNEKAAIELLSFIDIAPSINIGLGKSQNLYILVDYGLGKNFKLINLDLVTYSIKQTDIKLLRDKQTDLAYEEESESFLLALQSGVKYTIAVIECSQISVKEYSIHEKKTTAFDPKNIPYNFLRKLISRGYNVIRRISKVFIDSENRLCLGEKHISIPSAHNNHISLYQGVGRPLKVVQTMAEKKALTDNPNILFSDFMWEDGSRLIVDGRGFLHLHSSNESLPEVTIVSIQGKSTACWASDGSTCGNLHFIPDEMKAILPEKFYTKYITPFIQTILQKA